MKQCPDSRTTWLRTIELERDRRRHCFTYHEVRIDKRIANRPDLLGIETRIREILEKYKKVFRKDVAPIIGQEFVCKAEIQGKLSPSSANNYYGKQSAQMLKNIAREIDNLAVDGIVVPCVENGIVPRNIIPCFRVRKKDDNGNVFSIMSPNIRLVTNCAANINEAKGFSATQTDLLENFLNKVASTSTNGLVCKLDFSSCFSAFKIEESLYPYFCIEHPFRGTMAYARLSQGLLVYSSHVRDCFLRMFYKFGDNFDRFLDDGFLSGFSSQDEFLKMLDEVLKVYEFHIIRIKGKKMVILMDEFKFLGSVVKNGKIFPNPHQQEVLSKLKFDEIITVKMMKSYLGSANFLASHKHMSSEVFADLRKAALSTDLSTKIIWTDDLIKSFQVAQKAMKELVALSPFVASRKTMVVCDTSAKAAGAMLVQIDN